MPEFDCSRDLTYSKISKLRKVVLKHALSVVRRIECMERSPTSLTKHQTVVLPRYPTSYRLLDNCPQHSKLILRLKINNLFPIWSSLRCFKQAQFCPRTNSHLKAVMERLHNTSAVKLLIETATGFKWEPPANSRAHSGWLQSAAHPTKDTLWIVMKHTSGRRRRRKDP